MLNSVQSPSASAGGDPTDAEGGAFCREPRLLGPGAQPSVTTEGHVHSSAPSLPSGEHLAVPVWSDRCPRLGPAGEPALSPREPTPAALGEASPGGSQRR